MIKDAESQSDHVNILFEYLNHLVRKKDQASAASDAPSPYEGLPARITAGYYAKRILNHSRSSPCCLVAALIYIQRIQRRRPNIRLSSRTLQRLLLVAAMVAAKYLEDLVYFNSYWAEIGELALQETRWSSTSSSRSTSTWCFGPRTTQHAHASFRLLVTKLVSTVAGGLVVRGRDR